MLINSVFTKINTKVLQYLLTKSFCYIKIHIIQSSIFFLDFYNVMLPFWLMFILFFHKIRISFLIDKEFCLGVTEYATCRRTFLFLLYDNLLHHILGNYCHAEKEKKRKKKSVEFQCIIQMNYLLLHCKISLSRERTNRFCTRQNYFGSLQNE